jgi:hypothetical protein
VVLSKISAISAIAELRGNYFEMTKLASRSFTNETQLAQLRDSVKRNVGTSPEKRFDNFLVTQIHIGRSDISTREGLEIRPCIHGRKYFSKDVSSLNRQVSDGRNESCNSHGLRQR